VLVHELLQRNRLAVLDDDLAEGLIDCEEVLQDLIEVISLGLLSEELEWEGLSIVYSVVVDSHWDEVYVLLLVAALILEVNLDKLIEEGL
jgi:hypothetical protein